MGLVDIFADTFQVDDSYGLWLGWGDEDVGLGCRWGVFVDRKRSCDNSHQIESCKALQEAVELVDIHAEIRSKEIRRSPSS